MKVAPEIDVGSESARALLLAVTTGREPATVPCPATRYEANPEAKAVDDRHVTEDVALHDHFGTGADDVIERPKGDPPRGNWMRSHPSNEKDTREERQ